MTHDSPGAVRRAFSPARGIRTAVCAVEGPMTLLVQLLAAAEAAVAVPAGA